MLDTITLGNLNAKRDWGHAKDYVRGMWMMLQQEKPDDFVLATGKEYSIRDFCEMAFREIGIGIEWEGEGLDEVGKDKENGTVLISVDPKFFRPTEVDYLLGDPSKALKILGWKPEITIDEMVKEMVLSDLALMKKDPSS